MNGFRDFHKRKKVISHFIYPHVDALRPDVFAFQETHSSPDTEKTWIQDFGKGTKLLMSHGANAQNGVLLGFAPHLNPKINSWVTDADGRYVVAHVNIQGEPFTFVVVYLPAARNIGDKLDLLNAVMAEIAKGGNSRVVMCGDFNIALDYTMDVKAKKEFDQRSSPRFREFFDLHDWTDTWRAWHPERHRYTCHHGKAASRIDLVMASPALLTHIQSVEIGVAFASDHAPMYVDFTTTQLEKGKGYWRFPSFLLADPVTVKRIENVIQDAKTQGNHLNPHDKWDFVKTAVRGESILYMGECHKKKKLWTAQINKDIESLVIARDRVSTNGDLARVYTEKIQLMQIERHELISARSQEAREFNIARKYYQSNRPTKYYYRLPGTKYDAIKMLDTQRGRVHSMQEILTECKEYYSELYRKVPHPRANEEELQWEFLQHIPAAMKMEYYLQMDQDLTKNELFNALNKMKKDAALGMDGLTVHFYLQFWDLIGDLVFESAVFSEKQGCLSQSQKGGILRLIPKKAKNLLQVRNWHPITLLNVDYKIMSKAWALRLAVILPELVGQDQRGFVKNRYIGDNVLELYSFISQAENDQEDGVLLQLDVEKAFDSVSWSYLAQVLNNFKFPAKFVDWVSILYAGKEIRIINNGHLSEVIHPLNGLAQGDGLSPLLFVLVIETLALTLRANQEIVGFQFKEAHKKLSMLADDMLLSLKANRHSLEQVLTTLQDFAKISNLMVNEEKSVAFPIGPHSHSKSPKFDVSPFKWAKTDVCDYLGIKVPLHNRLKDFRDSQPQFDMLEYVRGILLPRDTIEDKLIGRKHNVQAFIGSKMTYYLSLAPSPSKKYMQKVQSLINKYFWSTGFHHISAKLLYRPYDTGGIQLYCMAHQNTNLKLKALNKLICNENEYWRNYTQSCFQVSTKLLVQFNLAKKHIHQVLYKGKNLPAFWFQVLREWSMVHYKPAKDCPGESLLFGNSALASTVVFNFKLMEQYQEQGIHTINDMLNFSGKLPWSGHLRNSIVKFWPTLAFAKLQPSFNIIEPCSTSAISRWLATLNDTQPIRIWTAWTKDVQCLTVGQTWKQICNIRNEIVSVKLQSFYW